MPFRRHHPALNSLDLQQIRSLVPTAQPGHIYLFTGPASLIGNVAQELVHQFAARGELRLLLGGNRFSLERLPLILDDQVYRNSEVLERLWVSRGETCYQLLDALQKTPNTPAPLLLTDMLQTLYEEELTDSEVQRVLQDCIKEVQRLCQTAPVVLSASFHDERPQLLELLESSTSHRVELHPAFDPRLASQLPLLPSA